MCTDVCNSEGRWIGRVLGRLRGCTVHHDCRRKRFKSVSLFSVYAVCSEVRLRAVLSVVEYVCVFVKHPKLDKNEWCSISN